MINLVINISKIIFKLIKKYLKLIKMNKNNSNKMYFKKLNFVKVNIDTYIYYKIKDYFYTFFDTVIQL